MTVYVETDFLLARERYEFHSATAETRQLDVLSSEQDYEDVDVKRIPLELDRGE